MLIGGYDTYLELLKLELVQLEEEGYEIPAALSSEINAIGNERAWDESLEEYYKQLENLKKRPDFHFVEPSELEEIRASRPARPKLEAANIPSGALLDKLEGALTGRFVGCALGQIVEGWSMDRIADYLKKTGNYPLRDFISYRAYDAPYPPKAHLAWKENIRCMGPDDDVNYTLMGLYVLEKYGGNFTWRHVADSWNSTLPYNTICTAETQAVLNYNLRRSRCQGLDCPQVTPQCTRRCNNPYREWIGAQIRADGWAYGAAGNPELAAEYAYRDASWTHVKNGIYGEMFFAAMIAAAFHESDPEKLVRIALGVIPENCRFSRAVHQTLEWTKSEPDFTSFMRKLDSEYPKMSAVHTINNAMICLMALHYGHMDPDRSIEIAVMAGKDTDCNGATVGSIVGAVAGRKNFGGNLAEQLRNKVCPQMIGFQTCSITSLARRFLKIIRNG